MRNCFALFIKCANVIVYTFDISFEFDAQIRVISAQIIDKNCDYCIETLYFLNGIQTESGFHLKNVEKLYFYC